MLPRSCRRPTQAVIRDPADVLAGTLMPDARSSVTASFRSRLSASRSFPDRPGANLLRFGRAAPICGAHRWQRATHPWSARCVDVLLHLPGSQLSQQPLQPIDHLDPLTGQLLPPVDQHPQHLQLLVVRQHAQAASADRDHRHGVRVVGVGLAVMAGVEQPHPALSLAGTSTTRSPSASSRCASYRPAPLLPSTAQVRCGHVLAYVRIAV